MDERRDTLRRQWDRDMMKLHGKTVEKKQEKRKVRRAIRHACKVVLTLDFRHQPDGSEEWVVTKQKINGRVLDLSEEGAAFFIKHPATANQLFPFQINVFDGSHIGGEGEVRWVKQKDSAKGYTIGIHFTEMDEVNMEKVFAFLTELDSTLGIVEEGT